jgi:hypothetical protein
MEWFIPIRHNIYTHSIYEKATPYILFTCCYCSAGATSGMLGISVTKQNAALGHEYMILQNRIWNHLMFTLENPAGSMVEFATIDGKQGRGYLVKSANPKSKKYIFLFHEWWGLNDYIKREADKIAADLKDVNVLAIDLYDGNVATYVKMLKNT